MDYEGRLSMGVYMLDIFEHINSHAILVNYFGSMYHLFDISQKIISTSDTVRYIT